MVISIFESLQGHMPTTTAELYGMASKAMLERVDRKERGVEEAKKAADAPAADLPEALGQDDEGEGEGEAEAVLAD